MLEDAAFAVGHEDRVKANRLLQVLRRWRAQSSKQAMPARRRSSTARSSSCSRLPLVPLSCVTFNLHSDDEGDEEDADDDNGSYVANGSSKTLRIQAPGTPTQEGPLRALSWPALSSPLRSCTPFSASTHGLGDQDGDEEMVYLNPSISEELEGCSGVRSSRKASLPWKLQSKGPSTPKGYLALYVGEEKKRFLVKASLLNHPLFGVLLEKAREEFGFEQEGPLNIPCEIAFFQQVMLLMKSNGSSHRRRDEAYSTILLHSHPANNFAAAVM